MVGIDDYVGTANDLDGAANDANDIAKSLSGAGAKEVVRLINDDASKDRIVAAWEGLVAKANPGDTIVFSYAGHGGQEPEPKGRHDEADGLNENFLLGRFVRSGRRRASAFSMMRSSNRRSRSPRRWTRPAKGVVSKWAALKWLNQQSARSG